MLLHEHLSRSRHDNVLLIVWALSYSELMPKGSGPTNTPLKGKPLEHDATAEVRACALPANADPRHAHA